MPPETNNARRFSCEKGCSTHLDGFAPRPGSGWTEEHIQSIACTRSVLSDPLLDKILALMGVQLVNDSFVQQLKHVRDLDFINRLGMPPWLSSPGQRGLRLAVPEGKFVLIPWHPRVAALNRLLVLAICFPGFAPGQETTPTAVVFDNLTTSEATHWYESCDRAVQQAVSVVMRSYGFEWSSNRKHKVRRVTWQQIQGDADDASLPQLGVIHAVQMILTSHGKHLMNASKACPWPRVTPRRVREAVLCFMGNHYGSVPPSTPTPGRDAKDRYPIGKSHFSRRRHGSGILTEWQTQRPVFQPADGTSPHHQLHSRIGAESEPTSEGQKISQRERRPRRIRWQGRDVRH